MTELKNKKLKTTGIMKANDLSQFTFKFVGGGHYKVTYETPNRGDYYSAIITDMSLIDSTKNTEWAKLSDIKHLRSVVIKNGTHYSKWGGGTLVKYCYMYCMIQRLCLPLQYK